LIRLIFSEPLFDGFMTLVFRQWMRRSHGVHWHRARLLLQMVRGLGLFT
jgi:hypothetical protein